MAVRQLEEGRHEVENQYVRSVTREGNRTAQNVVRRVFRPVDRRWRGIGTIEAGGLGVRPEFAEFDAEVRFELHHDGAPDPEECRAGEVLRGELKPEGCAAFGTTCTPEHPIGAPMVSAEGACAAYYAYRRGQYWAPEPQHAP